jgi:hypothetical protein
VNIPVRIRCGQVTSVRSKECWCRYVAVRLEVEVCADHLMSYQTCKTKGEPRLGRCDPSPIHEKTTSETYGDKRRRSKGRGR